MSFAIGDLKQRLLWCIRAQHALLCLLLVGAGSVYVLAIRPACTELNHLRADYAQTQVLLQQDQERAKTLPNIEQEIRGLRDQAKGYDKTLPKNQELAAFIGDVTRISQQTAVKRLSWQLDSKPRTSGRLTELPVQFSVEGDFQTGIVEFLRATENLPRLTRVRKLDLRPADAHNGQITADLTLDLYFGDQ